jgi:hypothetical protein
VRRLTDGEVDVLRELEADARDMAEADPEIVAASERWRDEHDGDAGLM